MLFFFFLLAPTFCDAVCLQSYFLLLKQSSLLLFCWSACLPSRSHFAVFSGKIKSCLSKTMMWNSCCHQRFCHLKSSRISSGCSDYQSHKFATGKAISGVFGWNCPRSFLLLNVNCWLVCLKMTLSCPRIQPLLEPVFVGSFQSTVLQMCNEAPPFLGNSPGCFCQSVKSVPLCMTGQRIWCKCGLSQS